MSSARGNARAEQSPHPPKGDAATEVEALKEADTTYLRELRKEHQAALKKATFEERRKHQQATSPWQEALEQARQTSAQAWIEVLDLKVQINQ